MTGAPQLRVLVLVGLCACPTKSDTKTKANETAKTTPTRTAATDARAKKTAIDAALATVDARAVDAAPRVSPEQALTNHLSEYGRAETCFAWSAKGQTLVCHREEEQNRAEMGSVLFFDRRGHAREYTYQFMEEAPMPGDPSRIDKSQVRRAKRRLTGSDYKTIKLAYKKLLPNKTLRIGGAVLTRKRKTHTTYEPKTDIPDTSGVDVVHVVCRGRKKKLEFGDGSWSYGYMDASLGETTIQAAVLPNGSIVLVLDGGWGGEGLSGTFTTARVYTKRALCVGP